MTGHLGKCQDTSPILQAGIFHSHPKTPLQGYPFLSQQICTSHLALESALMISTLPYFSKRFGPQFMLPNIR